MSKEFLKNVKYFSQGALKFTTPDAVIYTDPLNIDKEYKDADVVIITHSHGDHLSIADLNKVINESTIILTPTTVKGEISGFDNQINDFNPNDTFTLDDIKICATPAYNIVKTDKHPKENNWIGVVIYFKDTTVYYTSDTELIPEMKEIKTDIIFTPLGQTYTMNSVEEAVNAVLDTNAKIAVPIHYALYEGTKEDAEKFTDLLKGKAEVVLL